MSPVSRALGLRWALRSGAARRRAESTGLWPAGAGLEVREVQEEKELACSWRSFWKFPEVGLESVAVSVRSVSGPARVLTVGAEGAPIQGGPAVGPPGGRPRATVSPSSTGCPG